jgi:hypothetical protein
MNRRKAWQEHGIREAAQPIELASYLSRPLMMIRVKCVAEEGVTTMATTSSLYAGLSTDKSASRDDFRPPRESSRLEIPCPFIDPIRPHLAVDLWPGRLLERASPTIEVSRQ